LQRSSQHRRAIDDRQHRTPAGRRGPENL
jgi:hypothetical protein